MKKIGVLISMLIMSIMLAVSVNAVLTTSISIPSVITIYQNEFTPINPTFKPDNATDKSLIILDEVGRGTATYDGMSIAAAIIEYLSNHLHAKTLFSTHYHELTDMEGRVDGVKNYRVMVKEWDGSIVFLHKIARGSANRSFGIEVAKLAGLPKEIIDRAKQVLDERENETHINNVINDAPLKIDTNANVAEVINVLKEMDMDSVSPIMAFGTLQNLVDKVKK